MKSEKETIIGTASVELIRENPDGSADYMFNFPPEVLTALTRLGIMTAIQAGIEEAKHLNPDVDANDMTQERVDFPDELRHIAEQAGFCHDINNGIYLCAPMHMEKFAELIVRECVRYFNEDYQRDFDTLWREDLTKGIKEHFGVKA